MTSDISMTSGSGGENPLLSLEIAPEILSLIPAGVARRLQLLPIALDHATNTLYLMLAQPENIVALDRIRNLLKHRYRLIPKRADSTEIDEAIAHHYGPGGAIDGILGEIAPAAPDHPPASTGITDQSQPIVRLIDRLLREAIAHHASDIHFEPEVEHLGIRYRIDGVLYHIHRLEKTLWPALAVRLKILSGMNIAEARAPQDGHFSLQLGEHGIDFRAASHPTLHGENFVLRLLDRQKGIVPLTQLGLPDDLRTRLELLITRPEGIILMTGPTGSGKTTTLYAVLNHINRESLNIMTLEDPVEYPLPGIRQTSVNETARLDFASGIRSILRQDPDVILIGEIRDHATAEMAFRAAMTGHQVYATLHSNSAIGALPRLFDIGMQPDLLAGNIIGILAQRLVRMLCPHCRQPYSANAEECGLLGRAASAALTLYRPAGCAACHHQGYRGRMALMEMLEIDADMNDLISRRAGSREMHRMAQQKGYRPLAADAAHRVLEGSTSLTEVRRVINLSGNTP
ncbi:MAG: GspE/PulE family protein [Gallionella sp.]|nr:GspE/PulE family protein [Gallionella sp.]